MGFFGVDGPAAAPAPRRGAPADAAHIGAVLARAFGTDPVAAYLFPDPARRATGLRRFFALQLRHSYLPRGEVWVAGAPGAPGTPGVSAGAVRGAALWTRPDLAPLRAGDVVFPFRLAALFGAHLPAARRLGRLLGAHHPSVPHWYLGTIGVDPHAQRRGLGAALLAPVLARCDAESRPAYLECSLESNLAFYERHGFACTAEVGLAAGPRLWLMWREPRPPLPPG